MSGNKRIVVFGATSGIAQACLRLWAADGLEMHLVGRDAESLERIAGDLRARADLTAHARVLDLTRLDEVGDYLDGLWASGPVDLALLSFGTLPDQSGLQDAPEQAREALLVNGVQQVVLAEQLLGRMVTAGSGTLCVVGSVAGDRGRRSNYLYGSAKSMVATAVRGMQHRLVGSPVNAVLVKPGPTDTAMTAHLRGGKIKLTPAPEVATAIDAGIQRGDRVVYAPGKWRLIMTVIRGLPDRVFDRLDL